MDGGIGQFIPLILIFVIFYFFLIRPQQKKAKEHKNMVKAIKRGDKIITSGGIFATVEKVMDNDICRDLIESRVDGAEPNKYEVPMITELFGNKWKGKADIVNHNEKLVIDLKTTADIEKFQWSANKYNYDSQAYIYSKLFGYEMLFIVIDKSTHQIGMFDCSPKFYERGEDKVRRASEAYDLFYNTKEFDPKQYFISKTL